MNKSPKAKQILLLIALFVIFCGVVLSVRAQRDEFRRAYISPRMAEKFFQDTVRQQEQARQREERSRQLIAMIDAQSEVQAQKYRSLDARTVRKPQGSTQNGQQTIEFKGFEPVPALIIETETPAPTKKLGEIHITATLSDDARTVVTGVALTLEEAVEAATDSPQKIKFITVSTDEGAALDGTDFEFMRHGLSTSADRNIVSIDLSRAKILGDRLPDGALRNAQESMHVKRDAEAEWRNELLLPSLEERLREYDTRRREAEERILVSYYNVQPYATAIYGPLDNLAEIVLPPEILSIGERAFENCSSLRTISAPNAEAVGATAFSACLSLVSADLRKTMAIGPSAFEACIKLTDANFSNTRDVGNRAFYLCESLFEIDMPLAETIRDSAFERSALIAANLPSVRVVGAKAFFYCKYLRRIRIQSVESIGTESFMHCDLLESISMPLLASARDGAFKKCENLAAASLPNLQKISNYLFQECFALKNAILPSASSIGEYAFLKCGSLESATLPSIENFAKGAFSGCASLKFLILGNTFPRLPERVFENGPDGVVIYAANDSPLPSYYPDSFEKKNYDDLASGKILTPLGVEMLRGYLPPVTRAAHAPPLRITPEAVLREPGPLEISVTLLKPDGTIAFAATGDSLEFILQSAMRGPDGSMPFESCDALYIATGENIALTRKDFESIRRVLFSRHRRLSGNIPKIRVIDISLAVINDGKLPTSAFQNTNSDTLRLMGSTAETRTIVPRQGDLDKLEYVMLPAKKEITSIEAWAFAGCGNLKKIFNVDHAEKIGYGALAGCASIETIALPHAVHIEANAFFRCVSLRSISMPQVRKIEPLAFSDCRNLKYMILGDVSAETDEVVTALQPELQVFAKRIPEAPKAEYIEYDELPQPKVGVFPDKTTLRVGESTEAHVRPRAVCMAAISPTRYWSTDRPDIIDVAEDGTVTALAPGTADLWCIVSTDVIITTKQGEPKVFSGWPVSAKVTIEVTPQ